MEGRKETANVAMPWTMRKRRECSHPRQVSGRSQTQVCCEYCRDTKAEPQGSNWGIIVRIKSYPPLLLITYIRSKNKYMMLLWMVRGTEVQTSQVYRRHNDGFLRDVIICGSQPPRVRQKKMHIPGVSMPDTL